MLGRELNDALTPTQVAALEAYREGGTPVETLAVVGWSATRNVDGGGTADTADADNRF
jgi:hypothetical protein